MRSRVLVLSARNVCIVLLVVAVGILSLLTWPQVRQAMVPLTEIVSGRIVYIDPGHGGRDPGCVSPDGLAEKELVLDIAKRLRNLFLRSAVDARLIREEDLEVLPEDWDGRGGWKRPELDQRVRLANQGKGDLFVSIHANSFPEPVWSGAQTFYYPGREEDKSLAVSIQNMLVTKLGPNRRKAKPGEFWVLGGVQMPAAMVEVGFLSNPREAGLLATPEYRQKVAEAIFEGVVQYLVEKKTKRNSTSPEYPEEEAVLGEQQVPRRANEVVLYFPGPTNQDDCLVPELRSLPQLTQEAQLSTEKLIMATLNQLIAGPGPGSILHPLLPTDTVIDEVKIDKEGIITISLGEGIEKAFKGGGHAEELVVYGIVNTVSQLVPGSQIRLRIDAQEESSIGGHIWLDRPLKARNDLTCPK